LERVVENDHTLIVPACRLAANWLEVWEQAVSAGYEGMLAKDNASPYRGGRTLSWLKVKQKVPRG
jgi:ATP-dependent DNA ligase